MRTSDAFVRGVVNQGMGKLQRLERVREKVNQQIKGEYMSSNISAVTGRIGTDPEIRFLDSGLTIFTARMAVSHSKKKGDEWEETTTWYDLKLFGSVAEQAVEQLSKGDLVIVIGRVEMNTYIKKDGTEGWSLQFIANDLGKAITALRSTAVKLERVRNEEPF